MTAEFERGSIMNNYLFLKHTEESNNITFPVLYHYTSLDSFIKIISSKDLYLFNSYQMNDYTENNVLIDKLNIVLSENKSTYSADMIAELDKTFHNKYRITLPYISSLTESENSLSQWRAYGDDFNGICIKFKTNNLGLKYRLPYQNDNTDYLYCLHNIIYDEQEQKDIILSILEFALLFCESRPDGVNKNTVFAESAFALLSRFMCLFKLKEFSEECEWRIMYMPWMMGKDDGSVFTFDGRKDISFVNTRNNIKSYFPLFRDNTTLFNSIDHITLGTKSIVSDYEIRTFLDVNGLKDVTFSKSRIPIR